MKTILTAFTEVGKGCATDKQLNIVTAILLTSALLTFLIIAL